MSLSSKQHKFSRDLCLLIQYAHDEGYEVSIAEVMRPKEMQELYVKQGRSKTMNSLHRYKLAADLYFFKDGELVSDWNELEKFGKFWKQIDSKNEWGGYWKSFKDQPHFQRNL